MEIFLQLLPWMALIFMVVMVRNIRAIKKNTGNIAGTTSVGDQLPCPRCAENINKAASVCRFCNFEDADGIFSELLKKQQKEKEIERKLTEDVNLLMVLEEQKNPKIAQKRISNLNKIFWWSLICFLIFTFFGKSWFPNAYSWNFAQLANGDIGVDRLWPILLGFLSGISMFIAVKPLSSAKKQREEILSRLRKSVS